MRKFNLILGIYFALSVMSSLIFDDSKTDRILFIELNIWIVRLIWTALAIVLIYGYFNHSKSKQENN